MGLNEPSTLPSSRGQRRAGLSDCIKCGLFWYDAWCRPPVGKNWGFVWAGGKDEGGIEVSLVDLASGPRSCLGKERKKKKEGEKKIPSERFSTAAINHQAAVDKEEKERKEEKYVFHCVLKTDSGDFGGLFEKQH